jgi:hypothetical protein
MDAFSYEIPRHANELWQNVLMESDERLSATPCEQWLNIMKSI